MLSIQIRHTVAGFAVTVAWWLATGSTCLTVGQGIVLVFPRLIGL